MVEEERQFNQCEACGSRKITRMGMRVMLVSEDVTDGVVQDRETLLHLFKIDFWLMTCNKCEYQWPVMAHARITR